MDLSAVLNPWHAAFWILCVNVAVWLWVQEPTPEPTPGV